MLEKVENAKMGSIVPVYEEVDFTDPVEFFMKLSNYGKDNGAILIESADDGKSIGAFSPCLRVSGKGENFEITALNSLGRKFLQFLKGDFKFCDKVEYGKNAIKGKLRPSKKNVSEDQRLKLKTHMDILRAIAFKFSPTEKDMQYGGLFGVISGDFIDQFDDLPENIRDDSSDPDYEMYFLDNLFVVDNKGKKSYVVANALVMDNNKKKLYNECLKTIEIYKKAVKKKMPKARKYKKKDSQIAADATKEEFTSIIDEIKNHIIEGDILKADISRETVFNYDMDPLEIYRKLKQKNHDQFMFYINGKNGVLISSGPGFNLKIECEDEKIVEIKITGSEKAHGLMDDEFDKDLENKYEAELKVDSEEVAKHTILVDLARNNMARIAETGSKYMDKLYFIEKNGAKQYLASSVKGVLNKNLDVVQAYSAITNIQSGTPKEKAAEILRKCKKTGKGLFRGAFCHICCNQNLKSAIMPIVIKMKNNKTHMNVGANVAYDSISEELFQEVDEKAQEIMNVIKPMGRLK